MNLRVKCPECGAEVYVNLEKRSTKPKFCPKCKAVVYPATETRFDVAWPLVKLGNKIDKLGEKLMGLPIIKRYPLVKQIVRLRKKEDELLAKRTG